MDPGEAAAGPRLREPCRRLTNRDIAALLNGVEEPGIVFANVEAIGEMGESAAQSGLLREHDRRDERAGPESALLEQFGKDRHAVSERRRNVVADAMLGWVEAGEQRHVR